MSVGINIFFTKVSSVKIGFLSILLRIASGQGLMFDRCIAMLISRLSPPPLSEGGGSGHTTFTCAAYHHPLRGGGSSHLNG